jgi:D-amino-acid oxidase
MQMSTCPLIYAEHPLVLRAGVSGLTTALLLSRNSAYSIVVAAKHMPGDYDIEYASPWAGANYMP